MSTISKERSISAMAGLEHLSPQLQDILKRITRDKVFKLKGVGEINKSGVETDTNTFAVNRFGGSYEGVAYIVDPYDEFSPQKQIVVGKKIAAKTRANGQVEKEEVYEYVEFLDSGYLFVKPENKQLLAFMLFNNNNGTYKHRDITRPVFWVEEKVAQKENTQVKTGELVMAAKCVEIIRGMPLEKMKQYSAKLAKSHVDLNELGKSSSEIRHDLMNFAIKNPREFIDTRIDDQLLVELAVKDALSLMIINYIPDTRCWFFENESEPIMQCTPNVKDKYESELVEYLMSPARKSIVNKIEERLISEE